MKISLKEAITQRLGGQYCTLYVANKNYVASIDILKSRLQNDGACYAPATVVSCAMDGLIPKENGEHYKHEEEINVYYTSDTVFYTTVKEAAEAAAEAVAKFVRDREEKHSA